MKHTTYLILTGLCFAASFMISAYIAHSIVTLDSSISWAWERGAAFVGFCLGALWYANSKMRG